MARPPEEQPDFDMAGELDFGNSLGGLGPLPFRDSFIERRSQLYHQRSDAMDRIISIQRDIIAIERILGG